ncbi:MAG: restriction endonuclease subunit S [Bacillota bacterium]
MDVLRPLPARSAQPAKVDSRYLSYFFGLDSFKEHIRSIAVGATMPSLNTSLLSDVVVPHPPEVSVQRAIAHILGALDDKIELNRRMSETLEAMARALFRSWFVDFDPVRAKADGRTPGLPKPLADLFPARFVHTAFGEIPEGWEVGMLGGVAEHSRRGVRPEQVSPDTPYIALEHMPKQCIALSHGGTANGLESNKFEFRKGEILFGKLRPYFHKVGVAPIDGVCSTDIVVIAPRSIEWFGFVLGHVSSVRFVEYTNAGATGTRMPRTSWHDMARYSVVLPPKPLAAAFTHLIKPSIDRIVAGIHESSTLAALRNALLPKLIPPSRLLKVSV